MKSLQKTSDLMLDAPMEINFPIFFVNGEQMPEIDTWVVGEEYTIKVKIKMTHYDTHIDINKTTSHAEFDMLSYDVEK